MKKYRPEILLEKYCPTIFRLSKSKNVKWGKIDEDFESNYLKLDINTESNIVGIMLYAESGNDFCISFLNHCEFLASYLEKYTTEKNKFREIIISKFTNLKSLNYLNPIGELSVLKLMIDNGYQLIRIEDKLIFSMASPKDFLFKSKNGSEILVEVLNIHLLNDFENLIDLKNFLFEKIATKVKKETNGISPNQARNTLFFQPVLWHFNFNKYREYYSFFNNFSLTLGKEIGLEYNILGFCTLGIVNKTNYTFREISAFYDNYII